MATNNSSIQLKREELKTQINKFSDEEMSMLLSILEMIRAGDTRPEALLKKFSNGQLTQPEYRIAIDKLTSTYVNQGAQQ